MTEYTVGQRVQTVREFTIWQMGPIPKGTTGTVISVFYNAPEGYPIAYVKLDLEVKPNPWNNELHVFRNSDEIEVIP